MFRVSKKIFICFLAVMMMIYSCMVSAEETTVTYGGEGEVVVPNVNGWISPPVVTAETAAVIEVSTGLFQYDKGKQESRNPGGLVKYMAMLTAAENCEPDEEITFSKEIINAVKDKNFPKLNVVKGEKMTVEDCLNAVALNSAADASLALAIHVGGSEEEFVKMMNTRAEELGCSGTFFADIFGLENGGSYTTAQDMALILRSCIRNGTLKKIIDNTYYVIEETNKSKKRKLICEESIMLKDDSHYYEGSRAAALVYDEKGSCNMIVAAKKEEITYIAVTFGNRKSEESYVDCKALLDYAFNNFEKTEFMIGTVLLPKTVSKDEIQVKGSSTKQKVSNRYYVDGWQVGRGSREISESEEENPTFLKSLYMNLFSENQMESEIMEDFYEEEMYEEVSDEEESDVIDMVETVKEVKYFTVFGLSLEQWNHIGAIAIISGLMIYMIIFSIVRYVQKKKAVQAMERRRRMSMYEEE